MTLERGTLLLIATLLLCSVSLSTWGQPSALVEALERSDELVDVEVEVKTEIVVPNGVALAEGWLELTTLVEEDKPALVLPIPRLQVDDDPLRLAPELPNGPAMLCFGAADFAIRCQRTYLFRGPVGDFLGPLETELEWGQGTPIRGRYVSRGLPVAGARVAIVPAELNALRAFTMPLGPRPEAAQTRGGAANDAPPPTEEPTTEEPTTEEPTTEEPTAEEPTPTAATDTPGDGIPAPATSASDSLVADAPPAPASRPPRLRRDVLSDEDGRFVLPSMAEGDYFLEALLPSGQLHRSPTFSLPQPRISQERLAASADQELFWDLGEFEVRGGAALEVRVQSTTGEVVGGARITARQGRSATDLHSFQATTDDGGVAVLSGFQMESPLRLSCSAPGYISRQEELTTVPALFLCDLEPMAILSGSVVAYDGNVLPTAWVSLRRLTTDADADAPQDAVAATPQVPIPSLRGTPADPAPAIPEADRDDDDGILDRTPPPLATQVDTSGEFSFLQLTAGTYEVAAAAPGYEVWIQQVDLAPAEDRSLGTLRLMAGRKVDLVVVDADNGVGIDNVLVQSLNPPGAVDGLTDEEGKLSFTTGSDRGLQLRLRAEGYADAVRHFDDTTLRQDRPFQRGPLRLELQRPGWVRVVVFDEARGEPCQGCTVLLTPPGIELRTDEVGHVLSPPLEPGRYRVYRPRWTHLGSTVVEQTDAERRYANVKVGKTSLVRFGEERRSIELSFDSRLPADWSIRAQTPYHAERIQQRQDGTYWVRHRPGESLDLHLVFPDRQADKISEVRLGTLPADLSVQEMELPLRRSAIRGRLTDWQGQPLATRRIRLATLDRVIHATVWTDAEGYFHVPHAPEGVFGLHVGQRNMRFVSVSPAQEVDVGNIQLEPGRF